MRDTELDSLFLRFCEDGDGAALGQVFDAAAPELLGIASHLLKDQAQMEDVLQMTFITAIERARHFDTERRLMPWLIGILANHARNANFLGRRQQGDGGAVEGREDLQEFTVPSASEKVVAMEFSEAVREGIRKLPTTYRKVVEEHLYRGIRPRDLARNLGLSAGATRVRLHRGLDLLRRSLPVGFAGAAVAMMSPGAKAQVLASVREVIMKQPRMALPDGGTLAKTQAPLKASAGAASSAGLALGIKAILALGIAACLCVLGYQALAPGQSSGKEELALRLPGSRGDSLGETPVTAVVDTGNEPNGRVEVAAGAEAGLPAESIEISGRVRARGGSPGSIHGASVWTRDQDSGEMERRATTDREGRFRMMVPKGSEQGLLVKADGYSNFELPTNTRRREEALTGMFMTWATESHLVLDSILLVPGTRLAGKVVWEGTGRPASGMDLSLIVRRNFGGVHPTYFDGVGTTGTEGELRLNSPIALEASGSSSEIYLFAMGGDGKQKGIGWTLLPQAQVDGEEPGFVELHVSEGLTAHVQVFAESGVPVRNARVRLVPLVGPFQPGSFVHYADFYPAPLPFEQQFEARTGIDGAATLPGLLGPAPEEVSEHFYDLLVTAEGLLPYKKTISASQAGSLDVAVTLWDPEGRDIVGRVFDGKGNPIGGARVKEKISGWEGVADYSGRFAFSLSHPGIDLTEMMLLFTASADGFRAEQEYRPVDVPTRVDFVLKELAPTRGRIVDQAGQPLEGISLRMSGGLGSDLANATTNADGEFVIEGSSDDTFKYFLGRLPDGVSKAQASGSLQGGDQYAVIRLDVNTDDQSALALNLVDAVTGAPLDATAVQVYSDAGKAIHLMMERTPGLLSTDDLERGTYRFVVCVLGYATGRLQVDLKPGENEVTLAMVKTGKIRVQLLNAEGESLTFAPSEDSADPFAFVTRPAREVIYGALQSNFQVSGRGPSTGSVDQDEFEPSEQGQVVMEDLTPGIWRLQVKSRHLWSPRLHVEVSPSEELNAALWVVPGGVVALCLPPGDPSADGGTDGPAYTISTYNSETSAWEVQAERFTPSRPFAMFRVYGPAGSLRWRVTPLDSKGDPQIGLAVEGVSEVTEGEPQMASVDLPSH